MPELSSVGVPFACGCEDKFMAPVAVKEAERYMSLQMRAFRWGAGERRCRQHFPWFLPGGLSLF